jgi:hypothetical protein
LCLRVYSALMSIGDLKVRLAAGGAVTPTDQGWRLELHADGSHRYRLAQLDDQPRGSRAVLEWRPPVSVSLRARVSSNEIAGTWGFGLWNNPFGIACGPTKEMRQLPALPQTAWFFSASPRSYLSLRDDTPGNGFFAQAFRSRPAGAWIASAALAFPFNPNGSRNSLSRQIQEEAASVRRDCRQWHDYQIEWLGESTVFSVDAEVLLRSHVTPRGPLSLVIWIDNQYAAFDQRGVLSWGTEDNPEAVWLEVENLRSNPTSSAG